ncbi:MAG: adenylate/guanylate cyclase domain-containing protein [Turneriella sp.]|nr:adenylate/guanylate cyclase domain-containing protein [Turneriella sp.]
MVEFLHDKTVEASGENKTLLELALESGIPHVHECGGNGRCSTCRVLVVDGLDNLDSPTPAESAVAKAKGFPPDIRLACQARVRGNVRVRRLVIDQDDIETAYSEKGANRGEERKMAILFSDIRGFTGFAERNLPYDVVHVLNRYFKKTGDVVLANKGYIDKYIGDGLMCLFGLGERDPVAICTSAVNTALAMQREIQQLNEYLRQQFFGEEFRIGIGIHFGDVIIGEIGHPSKHQITAIGDNVNIASRVEAATKTTNASILVSEAVRSHLPPSFVTGRVFRTRLRGKTGVFTLTEILPPVP